MSSSAAKLTPNPEVSQTFALDRLSSAVSRPTGRIANLWAVNAQAGFANHIDSQSIGGRGYCTRPFFLPYSPNCLEGVFSELPLSPFLGSSPKTPGSGIMLLYH